MATQQPAASSSSVASVGASSSSASTSSSSASSSANPPAQEFNVRLPNRENQLKFMMMKFNSSNNVDFTKCTAAQIERENNFTEYKLSYDVDSMPKFGAGSEFGREQREIARRKKYGIHRKQYDPEEQPWLLKLGTGKLAKRYKGIKEGGVLDNASYYIFTQCPDGAFEAHPVADWYNFTPVAKYKALSHEEAEDEFKRRDRTINFFNIMLKKRLKGEPEDLTEEEEGVLGKNKKKSKKSKDLFLTDQDEWADMSDDNDDSDQEKSGSDEDKPKKKKGAGEGKKSKKKKNNSDSEAFEESDDMDEGKEVDYMTDTDSEDDDMYLDPAKQTQEKYEEKGVEDEEALKEEEEDEDEEKKENEDEDQEEQDEETGAKKKKEKKEGKEGESDSESSSDSDSDSDPEKEGNMASAIFLQKKPNEKKGSSKNSTDGSANNSRSATPTNSQESDKKGKKRKPPTDATDGATSSKKSRPATPTEAARSNTSTSDQSQTSITASVEGITEDALRRYLMRKPVTTKELLQKFRSKHPNMSKEQLFTRIGSLLKKIGPETKMINDKKYLTLKKT